MAKAIVVGNGTIAVGLNHRGLVSDFFFPYVGIENQVRSPLYHRIGVYVNGHFSWLSDEAWICDVRLLPSTMVSDITYTHKAYGIELRFNDCVHYEKNIFLRQVKVRNLTKANASVKLFFHQVFCLYGTDREDTALFEPEKHVLLHYEGRRVALVNATMQEERFSEYSVGLYSAEGKEGTYKDAEDGKLEGNTIEHGQVDSVLGLTCSLPPQGGCLGSYWVAIGETKKEVYELDDFVKLKGVTHLIDNVASFWHAWVTRNEFTCPWVSSEMMKLYNASLLYVRTQIDNRGAILASSDSDMLQQGRDTYSYMWPRDGALTTTALIDAKEYALAKRFFKFCNDVAEPEGYLLHKYRADRSLGSSWHPYLDHDERRLPIQEDETALVVVALLHYYEATKDLEFLLQKYTTFVKKAAYFMCQYIDTTRNLPKPTYDLWEEKYGTSTFTSSAVHLALLSASDIAYTLGKTNDAAMYKAKAELLKKSILEHLWSDDINYFVKHSTTVGDKIVVDLTIDISSLYGPVMFGVIDPQDERVTRALATIEAKLLTKGGVGGVIRYEGDRYFTKNRTPNPWFICTLWYAELLMLNATSVTALKKAYQWLQWCVNHAGSAGIMSEQVDPVTGYHISATPLTWSHAEYIRALHLYDSRYRSLLK